MEGNQTLEIQQQNSEGEFDYDMLNQTSEQKIFTKVTQDIGADFAHQENVFDDFSREPLMPYKLSTRGPALAVGDVNNDGLDDYYLGGAKGFAGRLFIQQVNGSFAEVQNNDFGADRAMEDVDAIFFDATGNGLNDLYVVSGGNEYTSESPNLNDRLYINQGDGTFKRSVNSIPEFSVNGSDVHAADFNGDGHLDLFVGGHTIPWNYGVGPKVFFFKIMDKVFSVMSQIVLFRNWK